MRKTYKTTSYNINNAFALLHVRDDPTSDIVLSWACRTMVLASPCWRTSGLQQVDLERLQMHEICCLIFDEEVRYVHSPC